MGWLFIEGLTVGQLKKDLRADAEKAGYNQLGQATRGNVWYRALETPTGEKFIAVYLMDRSRRYGAGYKSMDEDMGPCYYDCPVKLLELAPRDPAKQSEYSKTWRARVREVAMAATALRAQAAARAQGHPLAIFA